MAIFVFISIIFIIFSFFNFKGSFVLFSAVKMLALNAMCLRYTPPALSMETFLITYYIIAFLFKGYLKDFSFVFSKYPLKNYFIIELISVFASVVISLIPLNSLLTGVSLYIIDDIIYSLLFFIMLIRDKNIIRQFIVYSMIIYVIASIFGIYEFFTGYNFFYKYLSDNVSEKLLEGKLMNAGERLGMVRVKSLFVSPNNMIYGAFLSSLAFAYNTYFRKKIPCVLPFTFLAITTIFIANSRTVLLSSFVVLLPMFIKNRRSLKYTFIAVVLLLLAYPFLERFIPNITSVLYSDDRNALSGSSVEMRVGQLEASWKLFLRSPIVGNGFRSCIYFEKIMPELFGTESIWFKLLIERGIVGLFAYFYMFYIMVTRCDILKNSILFFYIAGYLVANTMSSLPGFSMSYLYTTTLMLFYMKHQKKLKILQYEYYLNSYFKR